MSSAGSLPIERFATPLSVVRRPAPEPLPGAFRLLEGELAELLGSGPARQLQAGDPLCTRGSPCNAFYLVVSGSLTAGHVASELGTFTPVRHLWPGDSYGAHCLEPEASHGVDVVAARASSVLEVPEATFAHARRLDPRALDGLVCGALRRVLWDLTRGSYQLDGALDLVRCFSPRAVQAGVELGGATERAGFWALLDEGALRHGERVVLPGEDIGLESALFGMPPSAPITCVRPSRLWICDPSALARLLAARPALETALRRRVMTAAAWRERRPSLVFLDRSAEREPAPAPVLQRGDVRRPSRWTRLPHVRQREAMDCGAACLGMVAAYHGRDVEYRQLLTLTSASRFGVSLLDLAGAAESLGFIASGVKVSWTGLARVDLPAIAHLPDESHFVVLWRVTRRSVVLGDPALGQRELSRAEFSRLWQGALLTLRPGATTNAPEAASPAPRRSPAEPLLPLLRPYLPALLEVGLLSLLLQLCALSFPLGVQAVVDRVIVRGDVGLRHLALGGLLLTAVTSGVLGFARSVVVLQASSRIERDAVNLLYTRVLGSLSFVLRRFAASDVMSRFSEIALVRTFIVDNLLSIFIDVLMLLGAAALLLALSPALAALVLAFVPIQLLVTLAAGRSVHAHTAAFLQRHDRYQAHVIDSLRSADVVQSHVLERAFGQRLKRLFAPALEHSFRAQLAAISGIAGNQALDLIATAVILWAAAGQVLEQSISLGTMLALPFIARQVSAPVARLASQWRDLQRTRVNVERMSALLDVDAPADTRAVIELPAISGAIRFRGVSLSERAGACEIQILKQIELEIAPGEVVAIVGPSGSGKSSLARLLLRLAEPSSGVVSIDGYNLADVSKSSLRQQIGYVTQDTHLFAGSVLENIACGRAVSNEAVLRAAMLAGAYEFIQSLPHGLHTQVGERGVPLSGGERQRLVIARALVTDPKVLIFDEATAALDPLSEQLIHDNLRSLAQGRTTLIISHRLQAIQHADRTVVLNEGSVSQVGAHQALAAAGGKLYAALMAATPSWREPGEMTHAAR